jgi:pimeloyl-ACP methyl ester carboxylesterase
VWSPKEIPADDKNNFVKEDKMNDSSKKLWYVLPVALLLVLFGGLLAWWTQTSGGTVDIRDIRFVGTNGTVMSALLYVPKGVTAKNPAPGIVAIHGYINSRETQDGFAIEFSRRGYVVLAPDQTGHGYSAPPALANGFGGPDSLKFIRTLDIVDKNNIGLEGHSMGGWASVIAAQIYTREYTSMVLEGSSTGTYGGITGTVTFPRNLGLVFSQYDEFSSLMWGAPVPRDIVKTKKLQTLFGTTDPVEVGKLYGSVDDGTARKLYMPAATHPQDHISTEAIGAAIEWFQMTLKGGKNIPPSDQVWMWKEFGTFVAFFGMVLFFFPLGALLLKTSFFQSLAEPMPEFKGVKGIGWWIGALITVAIPVLTFYWGQHTANDWVKPASQTSPVTFFPMVGSTPIWPQNITTGLMGWVVINGVITLILFALWHFFLNKKTGATAANYGVTWAGKLDWGKIGKSLLLAICIVFAAYMLLAICDWLFKIDFRLWVVALKPMSSLHFQTFLGYLIPFAFFFLVLSTVLHGELRANGSVGREMLINAIMLAIGFVLMLLYQYIPFFGGGTLGWYSIATGEPLLTIVAFQLVPLMAIIACVSTFFYHKTGKIYTGAFINALFITWYIVAGQAIHFAM